MIQRSDYIASTSNKFFPRKYGTLEERFWSKVSPEPNTGCWLWCGDTNGSYGSFGIYDSNTKTRRNEYAHRFSYRLHKGEIPETLQIDHICRVKLCVNPDHLHLVTARENSRRAGWNAGQFQVKTHCKRGHPLSGANLGFDHRGRAKCRLCAKIFTETKRPYVPRDIRIAVLLRQCDEHGLNPVKRGRLTAGAYIKTLQFWIFGHAKVHLDHDPALVNRRFDEDSGLYFPDANDPQFLVYRTIEDHRIKTYVRGLHGQHSDLALARKRRRKERKAKRPKRVWPKRKFPKSRGRLSRTSGRPRGSRAVRGIGGANRRRVS